MHTQHTHRPMLIYMISLPQIRLSVMLSTEFGHTVTTTTKQIYMYFFPSFSVFMEWVLHTIVTAMAEEKMGIIAPGGGVHTGANDN